MKDKTLTPEEVRKLIQDLERKFKADIDRVNTMIQKDIKAFGQLSQQTIIAQKELRCNLLEEQAHYETREKTLWQKLKCLLSKLNFFKTNSKKTSVKI